MHSRNVQVSIAFDQLAIYYGILLANRVRSCDILTHSFNAAQSHCESMIEVHRTLVASQFYVSRFVNNAGNVQRQLKLVASN